MIICVVGCDITDCVRCEQHDWLCDMCVSTKSLSDDRTSCEGIRPKHFELFKTIMSCAFLYGKCCVIYVCRTAVLMGCESCESNIALSFTLIL